MGITRTSEVTVADAWGDDDGGVTLEVRNGKQSLSIDEAREYGRAVLNAAEDAAQTLRLQKNRHDADNDYDKTPY